MVSCAPISRGWRAHSFPAGRSGQPRERAHNVCPLCIGASFRRERASPASNTTLGAAPTPAPGPRSRSHPQLGVLEQPVEHPALIAEQDGRVVGVLAYVVDGAGCEVLTLPADVRGRGVGTALIGEVKRIVTRPDAHGCG
jgi:hypothetical protein